MRRHSACGANWRAPGTGVRERCAVARLPRLVLRIRGRSWCSRWQHRRRDTAAGWDAGRRARGRGVGRGDAAEGVSCRQRDTRIQAIDGRGSWPSRGRYRPHASDTRPRTLATVDHRLIAASVSHYRENRRRCGVALGGYVYGHVTLDGLCADDWLCAGNADTEQKVPWRPFCGDVARCGRRARGPAEACHLAPAGMEATRVFTGHNLCGTAPTHHIPCVPSALDGDSSSRASAPALPAVLGKARSGVDMPEKAADGEDLGRRSVAINVPRLVNNDRHDVESMRAIAPPPRLPPPHRLDHFPSPPRPADCCPSSPRPADSDVELDSDPVSDLSPSESNSDSDSDSEDDTKPVRRWPSFSPSVWVVPPRRTRPRRSAHVHDAPYVPPPPPLHPPPPVGQHHPPPRDHPYPPYLHPTQAGAPPPPRAASHAHLTAPDDIHHVDDTHDAHPHATQKHEVYEIIDDSDGEDTPMDPACAVHPAAAPCARPPQHLP
ncbi:hypothetical protein WOLCODRAFT_160932, partial [Wolfiporia cocos MD-104 SS10]